MLTHLGGENLTDLKVAGRTSRHRQHHAAAHISNHRRELTEGVIPHFLEITITNQRCFNARNGIAQLRQRNRLPVIELLAVRRAIDTVAA